MRWKVCVRWFRELGSIKNCLSFKGIFDGDREIENHVEEEPWALDEGSLLVGFEGHVLNVIAKVLQFHVHKASVKLADVNGPSFQRNSDCRLAFLIAAPARFGSLMFMSVCCELKLTGAAMRSEFPNMKIAGGTLHNLLWTAPRVRVLRSPTHNFHALENSHLKTVFGCRLLVFARRVRQQGVGQRGTMQTGQLRVGHHRRQLRHEKRFSATLLSFGTHVRIVTTNPT